eukprot:gnl/MRDRNA2_/MRDRNA2_52441_c0_seq1.p1 gnl/MRDRNA2_/MRDRNA2_52441_c0~~gnl/MRDRNA2_/MRDRNA2_52441_c0_seq1.p1  ORF type:complete len:294 (+),score=40.98 gnl/MRDRNA2_/MRDRNA2_52441_c0_seq1:83-964(+)
MLPTLIKLLMAAAITCTVSAATSNELHNQYSAIFPSGNYNASSYRVATYLLERSEEVTEQEFRTLFSSFCAVSGSPMTPSPATRYKLSSPLVKTGSYETFDGVYPRTIVGSMYFSHLDVACEITSCKIDTKTVTTKDGAKLYHFAVIGNPCLSPEGVSQIKEQVPDLECSGDKLKEATLSDHGHVIVGMFHENGVPGHSTRFDKIVKFPKTKRFELYCANPSAESGLWNGVQNKSGVGDSFRKIALITPVSLIDDEPENEEGTAVSSDSRVEEVPTPFMCLCMFLISLSYMLQ